MIALITYTVMIFSDKFKTFITIFGTVFMLVYVISYNIFPKNIVFQKYPIIVLILIFAPCVVYLIIASLYRFFSGKHLVKNKNTKVNLNIEELTELAEDLNESKQITTESKAKHDIKKGPHHDIGNMPHHDIKNMLPHEVKKMHHHDM